MKVVLKQDAKIFKNSNSCTAVEYSLDEKDINAVIIKLRGRYPDKGRTANIECKELVYVIRGSGQLVCEDKKVQLNQGDVVFIDKRERFYWEGNMDLFMPCTPAWYPDQHKFVK